MSPFWSRILVVVVALPAVLGLVYLGGWWMFGLVAAAALLALHELFRITRPLRPLALAGFAGAIAALLGAQLSGIDWMLGGFLTTFALGFLLNGLARTRQSPTVTIAVTVLGAGWVGLGLAHLLLLRDVVDHGRLAVFTVILAVWADDTVAYFVGRLIGRHRLAPTLSPGKTWEGFVAGSAAAVLVVFFSLYEQGFLEGWRSFVLGGVIAVAAPIGDLFESSVKRDMNVKDTGRLLAGHGGVLDRIDALLFAGVASFYVVLAFGEA